MSHSFYWLARFFIYTIIAVSWNNHELFAAASTWTAISTVGGFGVNAPMLLTDGRVLMQAQSGANPTGSMWVLTPDSLGQYTTGTWSQVASLPVINGVQYAPLYHASAVLADGRVLFEGGEYNGSNVQVISNLGAIYDPVANAWTPVNAPSFFAGYPSTGVPNAIGDAQSVVLADGTFVLASPITEDIALFDSTNLTWTPGNINGRFTGDSNDEEGWTLLPSGKVLTINCGVGFPPPSFNNAQTWDPTILSPGDAWVNTANTPPSSLTCPIAYEVGPAVLLPNGNVFAMGALGNTAIYNPSTGLWSEAAPLPIISGQQLGMSDGPAALLPNGNVLIAASPLNTDNGSIPPVSILVYNYSTNTYTTQPSIPNILHAANDPSYVCNMLLLPTGQVMMTDQSSTIEIYTPGASFNSAWRPVITNCPSSVVSGNSYLISGKLFNGMSQGAMYGDDYQSATNYPLVRITNNTTGHVVYCRTHNHSSMGVQTGSTIVSTNFDVPTHIDSGPSVLEVVTNGIPSTTFSINVNPTTTHFSVSAPSSATAGTKFSLTVKALDQLGNVNTGYTGTVHFTSTDSKAVLPPDSTLNNGTSTFSATLKTIGNQTITATDKQNTSIKGTSNIINDKK